LDCVSGIATCALGHANDDLQQAVAEQMQQVHHVSNLYYIPQQAVLADWLVQNTFAPASTTSTSSTKDNNNNKNSDLLDAKVFFCNSGVEANEAAIKLARRRVWVKHGGGSNNNTIKPVILTATNSFHGRTITAISASGQRKYHTIVDKSNDTVRRDATNGFGYDGKMVPGFLFTPFNDVAALQQAVNDIQSNGQVLAGILMEALQGEGGMHPGTVEYFQAIRDICDQHDALMICDEVQVGMGRSGKLWGWQNVLLQNKGQNAPDIIASAKALGGGIPLGAMIASGRALNVAVTHHDNNNNNNNNNNDSSASSSSSSSSSSASLVPVWGPGDHASTYGGNPLACRAGLAVAQYYCQHDILSNVQARGEELGRGLQALCQKYPQLLQEMRGWGLMRGVQVAAAAVASGGAVADDVVIPPTRLVQAALDEGLLIVAAGAKVVRFVPPLIITAAQVDMALERFERAIMKILEQQEKEASLILE
jgi:acetylornithine/N-succinyldiaminopimelate aminotransferase